MAVLAVVILLSPLPLPRMGQKIAFASAQAEKIALIRLKAGHLDLARVTTAGPVLPSGARGLWVIQFRDRVRQEELRSLQAMGLELGPYLPDNAYLVRGTAGQATMAASDVRVRAVQRYLPEWKAPRIAGEGEGRFWLEAFPGAAAELTAAVDRLGVGAYLQPADDGLFLVYPRERLADLTHLESLIYVEEVQPAQRLTDEKAAPTPPDAPERITGIGGLDGTGQVVGVADTGLDTGDLATIHLDLDAAVLATYARGRTGDWSDPDGHGTHVAGAVVGRGDRSDGQVTGVAPGAQLVFQSTQDSSGGLSGIGDVTDLLTEAMKAGVRIHNHSWTIGPGYGIHARKVDQFVWTNKEMLLLFAAGNAANDIPLCTPCNNTVEAPSTAKNVISVGASVQLRSDLAGQATGRGVAEFSGRGYTPDGRVKPDLVAPGTSVLSTKSSLTAPLSPDADLDSPYDDFYEYRTGTSMATPIASGAAALVRQYFEEVQHIAPPASLIKAALINGAEDLGDGWMSRAQGWGQIDLASTLYPTGGRANWHEGETVSLAEGEARTYSFWAESGQIFKATLVWTDPPPATGGVDQVLVNDLDLEVVAPDGRLYRGNCFTADRKTAETGCAADSRNNVENVYIAAPVTGLYRVKVSASRIDLAYGTQPYSLVVAGKRLTSGEVTKCTEEAAGGGDLIGNSCIALRVAEDGRVGIDMAPVQGDALLRDGGGLSATLEVDGQTMALGYASGEVSAQQAVDMVPNPATGRLDTVAVRYALTNTGSASHSVGLRILVDGGAQVRMPSSTGMVGVVTGGQEYTGANVPAFWQAAGSPDDRRAVAHVTLQGGEATPPDRMEVADRSEAAEAGRSSVGLWWNPVELKPGETRRIVIYYGHAPVESPRGLALACPAPGAQHGAPHRQPLGLAVHFTNATAAPYPGVTVEVEGGLEPMGSGRIRSLGTLEPGQTGSAVWQLQPYGQASGEQQILVRVFQQIAGRKVLVEHAECRLPAKQTGQVSAPLQEPGWMMPPFGRPSRR